MELVLILDALVDPTTSGLRGASNARHLLYHSDNWDLDLVVSKSDEAIRVTGKVLPRGTADLSSVFNAVVVLLQGSQGGTEELVESARLTSKGEFEFRDVPEFYVRIEVFLQAHRLAASFRP